MEPCGKLFLSFQESLSDTRVRLRFFAVLKRVTMWGGGQ